MDGAEGGAVEGPKLWGEASSTSALVSNPIPSGKVVGADRGERREEGPHGARGEDVATTLGHPYAQSDRAGPVGFCPL